MSASTSRLAWGILGTGIIARVFARTLPKSRTGKLAAVGSRRQESADEFAKEVGAVTAHGSYEKLLADPAVQVVYISTPHPQHAEWCIKAARAKKHILCEKPLTLNHAEAMAVAEAARENGVFLMEAFMYRCHPQMARMIELIRSGVIGRVGVIKATFSFRGDYKPESRLFKNELGGGGILDVGCYAMSIARLIAGVAQGQSFANPTTVTGFAHLHPEEGTDLYAVASARFSGGILGQLATGIGLNQRNGAQIFGTKGSLELPTPYVMAREGFVTSIFLTRAGAAQPEEIVVRTDEPLYSLEADSVGDALARGKLESPHMTVADSLGNMAALDAWRASAGFVYDSEKPEERGSGGRTRVRTREGADASSSMGFDQLPPVLRTLLSSDGTVTKFLEAYFRERIQVKTLFHAEAPLGEDLAPLEIKKGGLILRRRVQMFGGTTNRLYGLAESFIRADILWPEVREDLVQGRLGIGELMRERRLETYREVLGCDFGPAGPWAVELQCSEAAATVARIYRIFFAGKPCLLITDRYVIAHFA